jgi:hypothetical protein
MVRKVMFFVFMLVIMAGLTMVSAEKAFAGFAFGNGNFETGDLSDWFTFGDVFVDSTSIDNNVIAGNYSAALINDEWYYNWPFGLACSSMGSGWASPTYVPQAVKVTFKVRYKTDWYPGEWITDPAHALVWTSGSAINAFSINPSGVTAGPGFSITRLDTNVPVHNGMPPFNSGALFDWETPTLLVTGTIPVSNCDSVAVEFDICNMLQWDTFSGLWVDDVSISFVNALGGSSTRPSTAIPCL